MKTLLLTAAAALALAGPAFADPSSFAADHFAQSSEGGDGARFSGETSTGDVSYAIAHFAGDESGDGARRRDSVAEVGELRMSTSNNGLVAAARAHLDNGLKGDN